MRHLIQTWIVLALALAGIQPVDAQETDNLAVNNPVVTYAFGQSITFQAQLSLPSQPKETYLLFRADGEESTRVFPVQPDAQGNVSYTYPMSQGMVRPFATVRYTYRATLANGAELASQEQTFQYEDNRFTWQSLKQDKITIHWYNSDLAFGQAALDVAGRGIKKANQLLLVTDTRPVDVYIYASSTDLTRAIETGGIPYVGGHTSPDLRLALVSVTPGPEQGLEMEQMIPHELAHILTYDLMGQRYANLPAWLREGIAAQAELTANPEYAHALAQASEQQTLIPIEGLCEAFPPDKGRLFLAYAEAQSFTSYIIDKFGQTGLLALTGAYGDGLNCQQGMQQSLGQSLTQVESTWRSSWLGENPELNTFNRMFPYLAILVVLMVVSLISAFSQKRPAHA